MHLVYYTPRNILHIRCFQFLLGITFAPRKIKDNRFANVIFFLLGVGGGDGGGVNKVYYGLCGNGEFSIFFLPEFRILIPHWAMAV